MRKYIFLVVVFIIIFGFSSCQKTPETPIVVGKGDGYLEDKIMDSQTASISAELPESGERVIEMLVNSTGTVELEVDADIVRYDTFAFPAVIVEPHRFSQKEADNILKTLVGDTAFHVPGQISTEQLGEQIIFYQQKMNSASDDNKACFKEIIKELEKDLEIAVPDQELILSSTQFLKETDTSAFSESIIGKFNKNHRVYMLMIKNSKDGKLSCVSLLEVGSNTLSIVGRVDDEQKVITQISFEQAKKQVQSIADNIGSDLCLTDAFIVQSSKYENEFAYQFVFTREVNGIHVVYDTSTLSASGSEPDTKGDMYQAPWPYEQLVIAIDENSIRSLDWRGPCEVQQVLNENVSMKSFEEIMNVFRKMIFVKNSAWETYVDSISIDGLDCSGGKANVTVEQITLGLLRVQSGRDFYLIPVWDFYGTVDYIMSDGTSINEYKCGKEPSALFRDSLKSMLTINAIDGSIIDRVLGY